MAFASEPRLVVLNGLRLKGLCDGPPLAAATSLDEADAARILDDLESDGLVTRRPGPRSGWALTTSGRAEHARLMEQEADEAADRAAIEEAYGRFRQVNDDLLRACTDWQLRPEGGDAVVNDHADEAYDRKVVDRLEAVDDAAQPVCRALAERRERFAAYGPRLAAALAKVEAGDGEWFTKPLIDSYHTVWFELHEDLLLSLAIERTKEEQA